ncbi:hypothetical protein DL768_010765 [Monosporascus sp. mg162]|nr:hypothetical protein DL768_010765 [Monosporascus sp. mg162]
MVLHDTLFHDLDIERLDKVLKPKVDGSVYLDEIFSDDALDFFVCLSSIAYVAGNAGQSAYAAANGFMASLAANRRSRGLAGSVINIGPIIGNGYIARELTEAKQMALYNAGFSFMSEQDFHEIFAEGVLASRPGSSESLELTTGLRVDDSDGWRNWGLNPMFQHLIFKTRNLNPVNAKAKRGASIKAQLSAASSHEQKFEILKGGFLTKLQSALQVDPEKPMMDLSPDALGVDSLVSVDLQSWFRKELGVDIPVLKILNAPSVHELLHSAQELLEPETVHNFSSIVTAPQNFDRRRSTGSDATTSETGSAPVTNPPTALLRSKGANTTSNGETPFQRSVPMSFAQSRFWFLKSFVEDQAAFNVTSTAYLKGSLDFNRLGKALVDVGQRHEALRTAFYTDETTKCHMQGVLPTPVLRLEYIPLADAQNVKDAVREIQGHVFDLSKGESLRMKILSLSQDVHCMIFGYHHIVMDGIGFQIFFSDLEKAYNGLLDTSGAGILQYPDFTLMQLKKHQQGSWSKQLGYWHEQFTDPPSPFPLLPLSRRLSRPEISTFNSYSVEFRLDRTLQDQIEQCCRRLKVTAFHFYLAAFGVLLFRFSDNTARDMCVGVADANRTDADVLQSLGLFLNLLPLRLYHDASQSFVELLKGVKATSDNAFANSRAPFNVLLDQLKVPRSLSHTPLFQTFFNYRKKVQEALTFCECEVEGELVSGGQNAYDISLDVADSVGRDNLIIFAVNSELYTKEDAELLTRGYISLLRGFAQNPAARIVWPPIHFEEDVKGTTECGRGPECPSQWPATLIDRIDDMAEVYASRIALTDGSQHSLSYRQMCYRVGDIASELLNQGLSNSSRVGIFQTPGNDWVCSLLAALHTRAACVPLDPQVGPERLSLMVKHCCPDVILVDSETEAEQDLLGSREIRVINVSKIPSGGRKVSSEAKPSDTAIIAYTSGSTGAPKGILLDHASYRNFVEFSPHRWGFEEGKEVVLQQSSYAFDMSLCQIFVCLGHGGTLVIPDKTERRDPVAICNLILSKQITFTVATPTEYLSWIKYGGETLLSKSQWRGALSGGEPLTEPLVQAFRSLGKSNLRLVNCYGPAEATFACADSIIHYTSDHDTTFALSPLPNQRISIVDSQMKPVPVGHPGQVVIAGAGVARGYLDQEEMTAATFLPDKHASSFFVEQGWNAVHLSADCGRFDAHGRLVLHGRIQGSTQIKMAGVRIDLEDIENNIVRSSSPYVLQAVVSPRNSQESHDVQLLAAFVVLSGREPPEGRATFLAQLPQKLPLPQYMRPSVVIALESVSNKVDRSAIDSIPLVNDSQPGCEESVPDLNGFEDRLRRIWEEALPRDVAHYHTIYPHSDFFHVGGNSLSLVNLQSLIRDRLGITVPIYRLFENITLRQMARLLQNQDESFRPSPVDWEKEVEVQAIMEEPSTGEHLLQPPNVVPREVIVTGGTGFLGREVVSQLIQDPRVTRIHCVAVRKPREELPPLFAHSKVLIYRGDLGAPKLGLSAADAEAIFSQADVLIHMGADVSFMKTYESLKLINVASTKELVRLSFPRRLPFHFVSSAGVTRLSGQETFGPVSVQPYPPLNGRDDGYTASKWVNEVYLERVSNQLGLPVIIHRPSSITGEGAPESDLMSSLMKYAQIVKAFPETGSWGNYLDFISVQEAAKLIIADVMNGSEKDGEGIRYVDESGEAVIKMDEILPVMEWSTGETFRVLPLTEWIEVAVKAGLNPLLGTYLRRMANGQILVPRLEKRTSLD